MCVINSSRSIERSKPGASTHVHCPVNPDGGQDNYNQRNVAVLTMPDLPIGDSFCAYTVALGRPLLIANALSDSRWRNFTAVRTLDLIAYAGVPILSIDGHPVGTVSVLDRVPRAWDESAARCLEDLAVVISALVDATTRDRRPPIGN